jgi:glycosyltransferase involved in cell wall biosynthesis
MAVYGGDAPLPFEKALESLLCQTVVADEVVLVEDGPIGYDLCEIIDRYRAKLRLLVVKLKANHGLAYALRAGLLKCTGELVARMDADDICTPTRFEKQLAFLTEHEDADVVGGAIAEFLDESSKTYVIRRPPLGGKELAAYARLRNPLNHMTVMFRKEKVLRAGSYRAQPPFEDYHLWVCMMMDGSSLCNLHDVLVLVRCGNGMQERRGGGKYARREVAFVRSMKRMHFFSLIDCVKYLMVHIPLRVVPGGIRGTFYRLFLRESAE